MGAAPGRAKTCKIMQIAFVRTSNSLPPSYPCSLLSILLLLLLHRLTVDFLRFQARHFLSLPLSRTLFLPVSPLSTTLSSTFLLFSSHSLSLLRSSAFGNIHPRPIALLRFYPPILPVDLARARVSVKNVSTIVCAAFVPLFLPRGWNTRLGGARHHRRRRRAPRDVKPRPPYLRLSAEWETKKNSPGNREVRADRAVSGSPPVL